MGFRNCWITCISILTLVALLSGVSAPNCQAQSAAQTVTADTVDTSTDFLSDDEWRALPRHERRERMRRGMVYRYEPSGHPSVENLPVYIERFAAFTVYDSRYYLYNVKATHVSGTTGSIVLSGEVYPHHYKSGIADALDSLGFVIAENNIQVLPDTNLDHPYGISTTSAATLRKEPRTNAEQLNSVALGGWIRVLRNATDADVTTGATRGRRSPGRESVESGSPSDWFLVQTMEGYIGFSRKQDFELRDDYQLPDGLLKTPTTLRDGDLALPAGIFVYATSDNGWKLFTGEKLPAGASITDLRPQFTADAIKSLVKPFMETGYVWGGVTDDGIDCSGFSQFFMRSSGVFLPRDAVQQATGGLIVAWGGKDVARKARPGDLIFFAGGNGRVSHVAISLGKDKIVHSAGKGVHFSSLNDPDDHKSDETIGDGVLFARRMAVK